MSLAEVSQSCGCHVPVLSGPQLLTEQCSWRMLCCTVFTHGLLVILLCEQMHGAEPEITVQAMAASPLHHALAKDLAACRRKADHVGPL